MGATLAWLPEAAGGGRPRALRGDPRTSSPAPAAPFLLRGLPIPAVVAGTVQPQEAPCLDSPRISSSPLALILAPRWKACHGFAFSGSPSAFSSKMVLGSRQPRIRFQGGV